MTDQATPSLSDALVSLAAGFTRKLQELDPANDEALRTVSRQFAEEARALAQASAEGPAVLPLDTLAAALLDDYAARRQASAQHDGVVGVRTGLGHLDETINGLEPGKLYLLAAMPGVGKTTLALQVASTIAERGDVALYISLENDAADLARKTACRLGNTSYANALKGKTDPATWSAAVARLHIVAGHLFVACPRTAMPELTALVEMVMMRAGRAPAVIVLDYLQAYVKRHVAGDDIRAAIDRVTPALRELGEQYRCAVLAIASQNRAGYGAGGQAALKESGDLEYGADVVMTLQRDPDVQAALSGFDRRVALRLTVDKNRQGMTGQPIPLFLNGDFCRVEALREGAV